MNLHGTSTAPIAKGRDPARSTEFPLSQCAAGRTDIIGTLIANFEELIGRGLQCLSSMQRGKVAQEARARGLRPSPASQQVRTPMLFEIFPLYRETVER